MLDLPVRRSILIICLSFFLKLTAAQRPRLIGNGYEFAADVGTVVEVVHENFSCEGRAYGYYADQSLDCKVFHICSPVEASRGGRVKTFMFSFFCPDKTIFSQDSRTCIAEEAALPCARAHTLYNLNKSFGRESPHNHRKGLPANPLGSDLHINNVIPGGSGISSIAEASFEKSKLSSHSSESATDPQIFLQSNIDGKSQSSRKSLGKDELQNEKLNKPFSNERNFKNNEQGDVSITNPKNGNQEKFSEGEKSSGPINGHRNRGRNSNFNINPQRTQDNSEILDKNHKIHEINTPVFSQEQQNSFSGRKPKKNDDLTASDSFGSDDMANRGQEQFLKDSKSTFKSRSRTALTNDNTHETTQRNFDTRKRTSKDETKVRNTSGLILGSDSRQKDETAVNNKAFNGHKSNIVNTNEILRPEVDLGLNHPFSAVSVNRQFHADHEISTFEQSHRDGGVFLNINPAFQNHFDTTEKNNLRLTTAMDSGPPEILMPPPPLTQPFSEPIIGSENDSNIHPAINHFRDDVSNSPANFHDNVRGTKRNINSLNNMKIHDGHNREEFQPPENLHEKRTIVDTTNEDFHHTKPQTVINTNNQSHMERKIDHKSKNVVGGTETNLNGRNSNSNSFDRNDDIRNENLRSQSNQRSATRRKVVSRRKTEKRPKNQQNSSIRADTTNDHSQHVANPREVINANNSQQTSIKDSFSSSTSTQRQRNRATSRQRQRRIQEQSKTNTNNGTKISSDNLSSSNSLKTQEVKRHQDHFNRGTSIEPRNKSTGTSKRQVTPGGHNINAPTTASTTDFPPNFQNNLGGTTASKVIKPRSREFTSKSIGNQRFNTIGHSNRKVPALITPAHTRSTRTPAPEERIITTSTSRPIPTDRGTKRFEPSAYLLQSGLFRLKTDQSSKPSVSFQTSNQASKSRTKSTKKESNLINKRKDVEEKISEVESKRNFAATTQLPVGRQVNSISQISRLIELPHLSRPISVRPNIHNSPKNTSHSRLEKRKPGKTNIHNLSNKSVLPHIKIHSSKVPSQATVISNSSFDEITISKKPVTEIKKSTAPSFEQQNKNTSTDERKRNKIKRRKQTISKNEASAHVKDVTTAGATNTFHQTGKGIKKTTTAPVNKQNQPTLLNDQTRRRISGRKKEEISKTNVSGQNIRKQENTRSSSYTVNDSEHLLSETKEPPIPEANKQDQQSLTNAHGRKRGRGKRQRQGTKVEFPAQQVKQQNVSALSFLNTADNVEQPIREISKPSNAAENNKDQQRLTNYRGTKRGRGGRRHQDTKISVSAQQITNQNLQETSSSGVSNNFQHSLAGNKQPFSVQNVTRGRGRKGGRGGRQQISTTNISTQEPRNHNVLTTSSPIANDNLTRSVAKTSKTATTEIDLRNNRGRKRGRGGIRRQGSKSNVSAEVINTNGVSPTSSVGLANNFEHSVTENEQNQQQSVKNEQGRTRGRGGGRQQNTKVNVSTQEIKNHATTRRGNKQASNILVNKQNQESLASDHSRRRVRGGRRRQPTAKVGVSTQEIINRPTHTSSSFSTVKNSQQPFKEIDKTTNAAANRQNHESRTTDQGKRRIGEEEKQEDNHSQSAADKNAVLNYIRRANTHAPGIKTKLVKVTLTQNNVTKTVEVAVPLDLVSRLEATKLANKALVGSNEDSKNNGTTRTNKRELPNVSRDNFAYLEAKKNFDIQTEEKINRKLSAKLENIDGRESTNVVEKLDDITNNNIKNFKNISVESKNVTGPFDISIDNSPPAKERTLNKDVKASDPVRHLDSRLDLNPISQNNNEASEVTMLKENTGTIISRGNNNSGSSNYKETSRRRNRNKGAPIKNLSNSQSGNLDSNILIGNTSDRVNSRKPAINSQRTKTYSNLTESENQLQGSSKNEVKPSDKDRANEDISTQQVVNRRSRVTARGRVISRAPVNEITNLSNRRSSRQRSRNTVRNNSGQNTERKATDVSTQSVNKTKPLRRRAQTNLKLSLDTKTTSEYSDRLTDSTSNSSVIDSDKVMNDEKEDRQKISQNNDPRRISPVRKVASLLKGTQDKISEDNIEKSQDKSKSKLDERKQTLNRSISTTKKTDNKDIKTNKSASGGRMNKNHSDTTNENLKKVLHTHQTTGNHSKTTNKEDQKHVNTPLDTDAIIPLKNTSGVKRIRNGRVRKIVNGRRKVKTIENGNKSQNNLTKDTSQSETQPSNNTYTSENGFLLNEEHGNNSSQQNQIKTIFKRINPEIKKEINKEEVFGHKVSNRLVDSGANISHTHPALKEEENKAKVSLNKVPSRRGQRGRTSKQVNNETKTPTSNNEKINNLESDTLSSTRGRTTSRRLTSRGNRRISSSVVTEEKDKEIPVAHTTATAVPLRQSSNDKRQQRGRKVKDRQSVSTTDDLATDENSSVLNVTTDVDSSQKLVGNRLRGRLSRPKISSSPVRQRASLSIISEESLPDSSDSFKEKVDDTLAEDDALSIHQKETNIKKSLKSRRQQSSNSFRSRKQTSSKNNSKADSAKNETLINDTQINAKNKPANNISLTRASRVKLLKSTNIVSRRRTSRKKLENKSIVTSTEQPESSLTLTTDSSITKTNPSSVSSPKTPTQSNLLSRKRIRGRKVINRGKAKTAEDSTSQSSSKDLEALTNTTTHFSSSGNSSKTTNNKPSKKNLLSRQRPSRRRFVNNKTPEDVNNTNKTLNSLSETESTKNSTTESQTSSSGINLRKGLTRGGPLSRRRTLGKKVLKTDKATNKSNISSPTNQDLGNSTETANEDSPITNSSRLGLTRRNNLASRQRPIRRRLTVNKEIAEVNKTDVNESETTTISSVQKDISLSPGDSNARISNRRNLFSNRRRNKKKVTNKSIANDEKNSANQTLKEDENTSTNKISDSPIAEEPSTTTRGPINRLTRRKNLLSQRKSNRRKVVNKIDAKDEITGNNRTVSEVSETQEKGSNDSSTLSKTSSRTLKIQRTNTRNLRPRQRSNRRTFQNKSILKDDPDKINQTLDESLKVSTNTTTGESSVAKETASTSRPSRIRPTRRNNILSRQRTSKTKSVISRKTAEEVNAEAVEENVATNNLTTEKPISSSKNRHPTSRNVQPGIRRRIINNNLKDIEENGIENPSTIEPKQESETRKDPEKSVRSRHSSRQRTITNIKPISEDGILPITRTGNNAKIKEILQKVKTPSGKEKVEISNRRLASIDSVLESISRTTPSVFTKSITQKTSLPNNQDNSVNDEYKTTSLPTLDRAPEVNVINTETLTDKIGNVKSKSNVSFDFILGFQPTTEKSQITTQPPPSSVSRVEASKWFDLFTTTPRVVSETTPNPFVATGLNVRKAEEPKSFIVRPINTEESSEDLKVQFNPLPASRKNENFFSDLLTQPGTSSGYLPKPTTKDSLPKYLPEPKSGRPLHKLDGSSDSISLPLNTGKENKQKFDIFTQKKISDEFTEESTESGDNTDAVDDDIVSRIFSLSRTTEPKRKVIRKSKKDFLSIPVTAEKSNESPKLRLVGTSVKSTVSVSKEGENFSTSDFPFFKARPQRSLDSEPLTALRTLTSVKRFLKTTDVEDESFRHISNYKAR